MRSGATASWDEHVTPAPAPSDPTRYSLPRDGDVPLEFAGRLLGEETGRESRRRRRWGQFVVRLYETKAGRYVVERVYIASYRDEGDYHSAVIVHDAHEALEILRAFDPARLPGLREWDPALFDSHAERDALIAGMRRIYEERVTTLLRSLPAVHERVD